MIADVHLRRRLDGVRAASLGAVVHPRFRADPVHLLFSGPGQRRHQQLDQWCKRRRVCLSVLALLPAENRHAASGIDGQSTEQFASEMEQRVEEICAQLKEGTYRAPPVRRVEIPKGPGKVGYHWGFPRSLTGCCSGRSRAFSRLCLKPISSIAVTAFDQGATLIMPCRLCACIS